LTQQWTEPMWVPLVLEALMPATSPQRTGKLTLPTVTNHVRLILVEAFDELGFVYREAKGLTTLPSEWLRGSRPVRDARGRL
jgi:hypothetical protein